MLIVKKNKEIDSIYWLGREIILQYYGNHLVWEKQNSCFGKGYWVNALPWNNDCGWKNEP